MLTHDDGENFEEARAINQSLTFSYTEKAFADADISWGSSQMRTMGLVNDDGVYTNLGLLLSDQNVHTLRLAVFEGTSKSVFKDRKEITGSLLFQLNETFDLLERYNRVRSELEGLYRIDNKDYPQEALREALLNAIVHREYAFSGSTLVSIFDDRIEIVNLGGLVKGITLGDIMLGVSVPRNKKLASVFYRLRLIEAYGTGMEKIMRTYDASAKKPTVEISDNGFKLTLPNRNVEKEGYSFNTDRNISLLTDNQSIIMNMLGKKEILSRKDVQGELELSQAMAARELKRLTDSGMIRRIGKGKNTRYTKK